MKTLGILVMPLLACSILLAQTPVKFDLMKVLANIPAPPATVKDAFARVLTEESDGVIKCSAARLFAGVESDLSKVDEMYKSQPKPDASTVVPGMSPEMAQKAQDPEFKKRMKKMSKEEKMKMAMEMMGSGTPAAPVLEIEPPAVESAKAERMKLNMDELKEFQQAADEQQKETQQAIEDGKAHTAIDAWTEAEIEKLPLLSSGEMSYRDPANVKAIRLKGADKHIALADMQIPRMAKTWQDAVMHLKTRFTPFYAKLIAADYASEAKNYSTKKILADAQIAVFTRVGALAKQSRNIHEEAASWLAARKNIEREAH
jgi:hypothetical protein